MTKAPAPGDALDRTLAFATELLRLETVERRTRPPGSLRHESSAEHSWHACMVAVLLAGEAREPIDLGRVLEILLVHDVPEIDVGDFSRPPASKAAPELRARASPRGA